VVEQADAPGKGKVVVYFTGADGSGPPAAPPTAVTFTDGAGKSLPLVPRTAGAARFESEPTTLSPGRELDGVLSATWDGEPVKVTFRAR
jgi:hypothetical protein